MLFLGRKLIFALARKNTLYKPGVPRLCEATKLFLKVWGGGPSTEDYQFLILPDKIINKCFFIVSMIP